MAHVDIDALLEDIETELAPKAFQNGKGPTFTFRGETFHCKPALPSVLKLDYLWEQLNAGTPGSLARTLRTFLRDEGELLRLVNLEPAQPETDRILMEVSRLYWSAGPGESSASDGSSGSTTRPSKRTSKRRTAST